MVPKQLTRVVGGLLDRLIPIFVPVVQRLRPRVQPFLDRHPRLMSLAGRARFSLWRMRVRARASRWSESVDPDRTYWVNPDIIEYAFESETIEDRDKYEYRGRVVGGDWDQRRVRFTEYGVGVYRGLEARFIRGLPWEETAFYQRVLSLMADGCYLWDCRNKADFDERCRRLDALFMDMKTHGYRSQQDIARLEKDLLKAEDEITVRVGRGGALLFEDGQHRLAMAKLLNIEQIPIKITARHSDWVRFKRELMDFAKDQAILGGALYQPATHPDLSDIPSHYGDERFELIKSHLALREGDLLDIGSNLGYFCHRFEEEGFNCYAVERDPATRYFLEGLRLAENRRFQVIEGSIFDYRDKSEFDVVLALNIFHHFIKTERDYNRLVELLGRLRMKVMFFQADLPDSFQMVGAYRNFDADEFVQFILDHSNLNDAVRIGETENKRPIYRLQAL
jgi:2-polyprenyl-3-methyl-5-hydroxy-6-metoxy-1,4-benzoquinol methylase